MDKDIKLKKLQDGLKAYVVNGGKLGRKIGSIKTKKRKELEYADVLKYLHEGYSCSHVSTLTRVSISTVTRLKKEFNIMRKEVTVTGKTKPKPGIGYTYLLKDHTLPQYVKIGKTNNIEHREHVLRADKPSYYMYKCIVFETEKEAYKLESLLHKKYKKYRKEGEWFEIPEDEFNSLLSEYNWVDCKLNIRKKSKGSPKLSKEDKRIKYKKLIQYLKTHKNYKIKDISVLTGISISTIQRVKNEFKDELK